MRALIVGASGLVGGAIARAARARGHEVTGAARTPRGDAERALDLSDVGAVSRAVAEIRPDVAIVASAWPYVDGCESDPARSARENVDTVRNLLRALDARTRIVFFSTDHVFDGTAATNVESDATHPLSVYARHKREVEETLVARGHALIARTAWVYGPELTRKNFVYRVVDSAKSGQTLRVPIGQGGCPTFSEWLAAETLDALEDDVEGILHLTGDVEFTKAAWARAIADALGFGDRLRVDEVAWAEAGQAAPRPARVVLASERRELSPPDPRAVLRDRQREFA